jgi:glycosyltransferase involved in cell wall biosynthesis
LLGNPTDLRVFDVTDIYCRVSIWQEASGLAVLEAMSLKLPVVANGTGGLPEDVDDSKSGVLVRVGGDLEICAALDRLLDNADLRISMGEAG